MSVEIKPICLVFFLPTLLFAQDTDIPDFLKFDTTLYGMRNKGVSSNSIDYSNKGPFECLNNYPKPDDKNQNRESCDFWWHKYFDSNSTHTGADFQVSTYNYMHENIYSFSFGRVCKTFNDGDQHSTRSSYVSVDYLLDSGDSVTANYLHFEEGEINPELQVEHNIYEQNVLCAGSHIAYVVKNGFLGKEGNTGLDIPRDGGSGCNTNENTETHKHISNCAAHLHLEFSDMAGGSHYVASANACTGDNCNIRTLSRDLDGLPAYYEFGGSASLKGSAEIAPLSGQQVWYNPDVILGYKKALIPVVYSMGQEGVRKRLYGYVGEPTETSLFFNRKSKKEFDSVSVLYERHTEEHKRNRKITRYYAPNEFNVALARQDIPKGDTNDNRSIAIEQADDYLFVAYLKSGKNESKSYPVIFSVLNPSEFIVDNDQTNYGGGNKFGEEAFSVSGKSHRVPGYYLTAEDLQEDASAFWRPNRRGRFTAQVFVPENMNAGAQDYQICNKIDVCEPVFSELQPVTPETHFRWLSETSPPISLDASTFIVTSGDNDPSTTVLADAIKFSYSSADIELIRTHLGIPPESIAAHYIVKHYMELDSPRVIDTEDGNVHSFIVHENKNEYAVYQLGKKAIGIDTSTHRIKLLNCSISTKWDASIHSFLRKIGIGSC